jgi:prephenate dehydrogenase
MRIGIIGSGLIGKTLARKFSAGGHSVLVANSRSPETIATRKRDHAVGMCVRTGSRLCQNSNERYLCEIFDRFLGLRRINVFSCCP